MPIAATWRAPVRFPEADALSRSTPVILADVVSADPSRVQVIDDDVRLSGAGLLAEAARIQSWLSRAGVGRGDGVCVQLPNWWEAVATAHAVWGMGAVLCPVPVNYRATEVAAILRATRIAAVITAGEYRGVDHPAMVGVAQEAAGTAAPTLVVRPSGTVVPPQAADLVPELSAGLDDVCLLMFTSGTTGRAKGVLHSHRSLLADAASIASLFRMVGDRVFMPSPVAHITGLLYGVLMPLLMGGDCVLQHQWQADRAVDLIERHGCRTCVGATPFLRGLADEYARRGQSSVLTSFICGGADVPPSLVREAELALGATVVRAYGLTEMPTVTCGGPDDPETIRAGTDGRLTGSSQARLAEPVDGVGELEVRGPELFLGYLDPADTARAVTADGWFRTGDLARLEGDAVTIVGRAKDIIVRGGENISTKEVEDYLAEHPLVDDIAIVGVPDPVLGEKACAVVVARGNPPDLAALSAYLVGRHIAKHKIPEYLLVVDSLPRTPSGKVQKFQLRADAVALLGAGDGEAEMNTADLLRAFEQMVLIRRMEERISVLYRDGHIPGFVHSSVGQEGVAVGTLFHARPDDIITSTHRGHGHVLAKGLDPRRMLAELMGKETGSCKGRGGSMHVADPSIGIFGANGIVGAGMPIGVGAAFAAQRSGDRVVISFFGDGAVATGSFHESLNLAALWRLPMVFLCENNQFSEFSRATDQHPVPLASRAAAFGVPFVSVPGEDVAAVADGLADVLREVRSGGGPYLVEAVTLRVRGHYEGDRQTYRDADEDTVSRTDPLIVTRERLLAAGVGAGAVDAAENRAAKVVAEAEAFAWASPEPPPESATDFLIASRDHVVATELPAEADAPTRSTSKIIRQALGDALADDPAVFLAGIDVGNGNVFGLTRGLRDEFGDRVLDTPIAETAIVGLGVGSAMAGLRPVIEIMYLDFIGVCFDQIMNQAAKLRFMTGGAVTMPLVIRTQFGSGRSSGSQHSQSLEALLAHIPGLTVVMPSTGADTYGLLRSAIEDDNPVVFIENRLLYEQKAALPHRDHRVPLGKARIARPGRDLTIVSWSRMLHHSLSAADVLAAEGIEVEVLDLRTIVPLDREAILESLARTNKLVIAQEAVTDFGVGAEIAALAVREGFWSLDAPVARVGAPYSPAPYASSLEANWIPGVDNIVTVAREIAHV